MEATTYCLYARKSSEDDERQALSIDSQVKEMVAIAERENLNIAEIRRESHSAKVSGGRPVFNKLLEDIHDGMFSGIIAWAPDRLSRNAGDLGSVVDLMDSGKLQEIRTHSQTFTNSPNEKFLLMILCSQAKLENDNRGINVKRGLKNKAEMGIRPGVARWDISTNEVWIETKARLWLIRNAPLLLGVCSSMWLIMEPVGERF